VLLEPEDSLLRPVLIWNITESRLVIA